MFLTPPSPSRTKVFSKLPHERSPPSHIHINHDTHPPPSAHTNYLPALGTSASGMTTQHRGLERNLPPPPGPSLPEPVRQDSARHVGYEQARGGLPPPTPSRQQTYDRGEYRPQPDYRERAEYRQPQPEARPTSSSDLAKVEELKYHQETERTKQESLRTQAEEAKIAQRRIEQDIIMQAMSYRTHPNLIPLIFVGLGSANSNGFENAQQYITTIQQIQTHFGNTLPQGLFSTGSPDLRRDYRTTPAGPMQYGALGQQLSALGSQSGSASAPGTGVYPSPAYQTPQSGHMRQTAGQSAIARQHPTTATKAPPVGSSLPRLSTNEAQVSSGAGPNHGQAASAAQAAGPPGDTESPIYFHHWQPPATQTTGGKEPTKTSPKHNPGLSNSSQPTSSPRKRKATGEHEAVPRPSSSHQRVHSPAMSTSSSKRAGRRKESVDSAIAERQQDSRATSRERQLKTEESMKSVPESETTSQPTSAPTSTEISSKPHTAPGT